MDTIRYSRNAPHITKPMYGVLREAGHNHIQFAQERRRFEWSDTGDPVKGSLVTQLQGMGLLSGGFTDIATTRDGQEALMNEPVIDRLEFDMGWFDGIDKCSDDYSTWPDPLVRARMTSFSKDDQHNVPTDFSRGFARAYRAQGRFLEGRGPNPIDLKFSDRAFAKEIRRKLWYDAIDLHYAQQRAARAAKES